MTLINATCSCGASNGKSPAHKEAARHLAEVFHKEDISVVYGGGTVGLMGEVARTLVSLSGPAAVHGVIPSALIEYEQAQDASKHANPAKVVDEVKYGRTTVVKDMHSRKELMARDVLNSGQGSGFVALSGGYGTLEELMEIVTWNQLGIHSRPVILFNVEGYWDGLLQWVHNATESGFIRPGNTSILVEAKTAEEVVDCLNNYKPAGDRLSLNWTMAEA